MEEQADLTLANRRFKNAHDLYCKVLQLLKDAEKTDRDPRIDDKMSLVRSKRDRVNKLVELSKTTMLVEQAEGILQQNKLSEARQNFAQASGRLPKLAYLDKIIEEIQRSHKQTT